jgi:hypothetical protein
MHVKKSGALLLVLVLAASSLVFLFLPAIFLAVVEVYAQAYPYNPVYNDVAPPKWAEAPTVTIYAPSNSSSYPKNVTLTFYVTLPRTNNDKVLCGLVRIYYRGSWENKEFTFASGVLGGSIDLSDVPGGNLSVTIYAVGVGYVETGSDAEHTYYDRFEITGYLTVSFIKDVVPPRITVLYPQNRSYFSSEVKLDFTVSEDSSEILYCLDGKENQTITGNATLAGLANGKHNLILYMTAHAGNAGSSKILFFNVNVSEPFPLVAVATVSAASVTVVCAGALFYFKKRKH